LLICRSCYRGQAYCNDECRKQGRHYQRKKANQRYELDPEVLHDHCLRQRAFRQRQREQRALRVTDQPSQIDGDMSSMSEPLAETGKVPSIGQKAQNRPKHAWGGRFAQLVCMICGRVGRFIAAFTRWGVT
jgi:hypothetical protein